MVCPDPFRNILPYYFIKYNGKEKTTSNRNVQLSLLDDSDIVIEDE